MGERVFRRLTKIKFIDLIDFQPQNRSMRRKQLMARLKAERDHHPRDNQQVRRLSLHTQMLFSVVNFNSRRMI